MTGVGLFYRRGYFSQRLNLSGTQQEYWLEHDPAELPMALVHGDDGLPLRLSVDVFGHPADWPALEAIAARHGLALVTDSCESLGSARLVRPLRRSNSTTSRSHASPGKLAAWK